MTSIAGEPGRQRRREYSGFAPAHWAASTGQVALRHDTKPDWPVTLLLTACVFQNFILALGNTYRGGITQTVVMAIQLGLTALAGGIVLSRKPALPQRFYWALYAFALLVTIATWRTGDIDFRFLYDALLIPIFIALGTTLERFPLRATFVIAGVVAVVALVELLRPDLYVQFIDPLSYYVATRDWVGAQIDESTLTDPGLYLGSVRPGGLTLLGGMSGSRLGSIFLEPLSLGYFAVVMTLVAHYFFARQVVVRLALTAGFLLLAVFADSRVAAFCIVATVVLWPIASRVPLRVSAFPPFLLLAAFAVVAALTGGELGSDDLANRLAITGDALQQSSMWDVIFGGIDAERAGDSGVVAIVSHAGLLAVPLLMALYSGLLAGRRTSIALCWCAFLYVAVASLFGGALFSIKTAPLLGLLVGYASSRASLTAERPFPGG